MISLATSPALHLGTPFEVLPAAGERLPHFVPTLADLFRLDPLLASKVDATSEAGCWLWTGARVMAGRANRVPYGCLKRAQRVWYTHRWTWTLMVGPIPAGHEVHHECSTPLCCNPAHLDALDPDDHDWLHREAGKYAAEAAQADRIRSLVDLTTTQTRRRA